jgi:glycosyltransferase involved in cell wall biosynthesis
MFPSEGLPVHGVFVRNRLQALARYVDLRVISPVPVFPVATRVVPRYRPRLRIPRSQVHPGSPPLAATYPRYLSIPKVLKPVDGVTVAAAVWAEVLRLRREGFVPDVLDAHLAFPEGFAAALVAPRLGIPFTVTLRGHDINDLHRYAVRWRQVGHALRRATRVIGVCRALVDGAIELGVDPEDAVVITNGVDPQAFRRVDRAEARAALGLPADARVVLSVGHMVPRKGFHVLVDALAELRRPDVHMVFVGAAGEEGDFVGEVKRRVAAHGLGDRVRFAGAVVNHELYRYYSAADVFALASDKEGWPNVLFEALACGTPVVATRVWGTPECIASDRYGLLVEERTGPAFAVKLAEALDRSWDADALVRYARANDWDGVARRTATELERARSRFRGESYAALAERLGPPPTGAVQPGEVESA